MENTSNTETESSEQAPAQEPQGPLPRAPIMGMTEGAVIREIEELLTRACDDERRVLLYIARRIVNLGRNAYGPLSIADYGRNPIVERNEEISDLLFYASIASLRDELSLPPWTRWLMTMAATDEQLAQRVHTVVSYLHARVPTIPTPDGSYEARDGERLVKLWWSRGNDVLVIWLRASTGEGALVGSVLWGMNKKDDLSDILADEPWSVAQDELAARLAAMY